MVLKKNVNSALKVLKEMKEADVKPDSVTFSYLINYCGEEATIAKVIKLYFTDILPCPSLFMFF